ncbi:acyl-CoA dehydrogenase family protein, partial [Puniceibacterium confluentis]|uniref:acyl-CoA dehydrogenase family protein n=1 Tax=Puniceibacterium confluentis TaxID=1958944 RepID=UPI003561B082
MDFTISDEMKMVTEAVGRFVREKVQPLEVETEEAAAIPADRLVTVRTEAQALGFYALNMSEEVGGGGLGVLDMCLVEEKL